ncbi:hypothetical protein HDU97_003226 [Phlyctochytrium planicorne]|nr:hypothetical protein HDU97_003226 [Phlyctochytrium planicorne]
MGPSQHSGYLPTSAGRGTPSHSQQAALMMAPMNGISSSSSASVAAYPPSQPYRSNNSNSNPSTPHFSPTPYHVANSPVPPASSVFSLPPPISNSPSYFPPSPSPFSRPTSNTSVSSTNSLRHVSPTCASTTSDSPRLNPSPAFHPYHPQTSQPGTGWLGSSPHLGPKPRRAPSSNSSNRRRQQPSQYQHQNPHHQTQGGHLQDEMMELDDPSLELAPPLMPLSSSSSSSSKRLSNAPVLSALVPATPSQFLSHGLKSASSVASSPGGVAGGDEDGRRSALSTLADLSIELWSPTSTGSRRGGDGGSPLSDPGVVTILPEGELGIRTPGGSSREGSVNGGGSVGQKDGKRKQKDGKKVGSGSSSSSASSVRGGASKSKGKRDGKVVVTTATQTTPPQKSQTATEPTRHVSRSTSPPMSQQGTSSSSSSSTTLQPGTGANATATAVPPNTDRPHACPFPNCTARFRRRQEMLRHGRSVHGGDDVRPFVCPGFAICGRRFARGDALRRHVEAQRSQSVGGCVGGLSKEEVGKIGRRGVGKIGGGVVGGSGGSGRKRGGQGARKRRGAAVESEESEEEEEVEDDNEDEEEESDGEESRGGVEDEDGAAV